MASKEAKAAAKAAKAEKAAARAADREQWEVDMKAAADKRGLPAYRPAGTKASWWKK